MKPFSKRNGNANNNNLCFLCHRSDWKLLPSIKNNIEQHIKTVFKRNISTRSTYELCSGCWFNMTILAAFESRNCNEIDKKNCFCKILQQNIQDEEKSTFQSYLTELRTKYNNYFRKNCIERVFFIRPNIEIPQEVKDDKKYFRSRVKLTILPEAKVRTSKRFNSPIERINVIHNDLYQPKGILYTPEGSQLNISHRKRVSWSNSMVTVINQPETDTDTDTDDEDMPIRKKIKIKHTKHPSKYDNFPDDLDLIDEIKFVNNKMDCTPVNGNAKRKRYKKEINLLRSSSTSSEEEDTSLKNEGTSSKDEGTSSKDKGTSSKEEGISLKDEGTSSKDEGTSWKDEGTSSKEEGTSLENEDEEDKNNNEDSNVLSFLRLDYLKQKFGSRFFKAKVIVKPFTSLDIKDYQKEGEKSSEWFNEESSEKSNKISNTKCNENLSEDDDSVIGTQFVDNDMDNIFNMLKNPIKSLIDSISSDEDIVEETPVKQSSKNGVVLIGLENMSVIDKVKKKVFTIADDSDVESILEEIDLTVSSKIVNEANNEMTQKLIDLSMDIQPIKYNMPHEQTISDDSDDDCLINLPKTKPISPNLSEDKTNQNGHINGVTDLIDYDDDNMTNSDKHKTASKNDNHTVKVKKLTQDQDNKDNKKSSTKEIRSASVSDDEFITPTNSPKETYRDQVELEDRLKELRDNVNSAINSNLIESDKMEIHNSNNEGEVEENDDDMEITSIVKNIISDTNSLDIICSLDDKP